MMAGRSRNNDMYQRPEAIDPGFVDVEPLKLFSPEVAGMDAQNLGQSQQRYDQSQTAIAKYIEDIGATPMSEQDKKFAYGKLQKDLDNIHEQVKTKGGDYSNYLPEIVKSLSKARGTLHLAKQRYEEEQKLAPILSKLQAEGKLLWENGVDPRTQSVFDKEGKYKGGLNYDFREQSNYDDIVNKGVVQGIDKLVREGGLQGSGYEGLLQQIQTQGLSALDEGKGVDKNTRDNFVKELAKEFKNEFERTSTWGIDAKMKATYGDNSENYIESAINRLAKDVQTRKYMQNPGYKPKEENTNPSNPYYGLYTKSSIEDKAKVEAKRKELSTLVASIDNPSILITSSDRGRAPLSPNVLPSFGNNEQDLIMAIGKRTQEINKYKKDYNPIWNYIKYNAPKLLKPDEVDKMFLNHLIKLDLPANLAKESNLIISPIDSNVFSALKTSLQRQMSGSNLYSGEDKKIGSDVFGTNGENIQNIEFVPAKGNIVFMIKDGETSKEYSLKDKDMANLPNELKLALQTVEELYKGKFDYSLDSDEIESPIFVNMDVYGHTIPVKPTFTWITNPKTGEKIFTKKYQVIKDGKLQYITNEYGSILEEPVREFPDIINPFFAQIAATQGVVN